SGGTHFNFGVVPVGADGSLGAAGSALTFDGGTLATTAAFTTARAVTLNAADGTIDPAAGDLTLSGAVGGVGELFINGTGSVSLTNITNSYSGGTAVNGCTVAINTNANLVAAGGALTLNTGTLKALGGFRSSPPLVVGRRR